MKSESRKFLLRFSLAAVLLGSSGALAIEIPTGKDFKLNISILAQPRASFSWDGDKPTATTGASPNGSLDTDFYIRRARLYVSGTAFKIFTFYLMLDQPNLGVRGDYTGANSSAYVQDLHVGVKPNEDLDIEAGFLYMPFTHLALNSAPGTLSIEKPTAILFYNRSRGLRENGVQARALLFDRQILVRGGLYEGLHGDPNATLVVNPYGRPLVAGTVRFNVVGYEAGYAYPTMYLDGKTRISFGISGQYQNKGSNTPVTTINAMGNRVTTNTAVNDYLAYAADFFADLALSADTEFSIQTDLDRFDWGSGSNNTGWGATLETGFRIGKIVPEVNGYWFNSESKQNNFGKIAVGLTYLLKGHQAKVSAEFWTSKNGVHWDQSRALHQIVLQFQAYY
jgi:hypothetical protein